MEHVNRRALYKVLIGSVYYQDILRLLADESHLGPDPSPIVNETRDDNLAYLVAWRQTLVPQLGAAPVPPPVPSANPGRDGPGGGGADPGGAGGDANQAGPTLLRIQLVTLILPTEWQIRQSRENQEIVRNQKLV